jgi:hypothetical protein
VKERSPLRLGQVLLDEGEHLAFLVCQVIQHDRRQVLDVSDPTAAAQSRLAAASEPFHEPSGDRFLPGQGGMKPVGA